MELRRTIIAISVCALGELAGCATETPADGALASSADDDVFEAAHCNAPLRNLIPSTSFAAMACADTGTRADVQFCACTISLQTSAAQLDPAHWYDDRGVALLRMGEAERAIRDLDEALSVQPDLVSAHLHRGNAFAAQKDYGRALVDYNQALELDPKYAPALSARCWARAVWHKAFEAALSDCEASLTLRAGDAATLASRALIRYQMAQFDLAIADCSASLAIDPNSAGCLYLRALAHRQSGAEELARADLHAALALDPAIERQYRELGVRAD